MTLPNGHYILLSTKIIIHVKMATIVDIFTFINMIDTKIKSLKEKKVFISQDFYLLLAIEILS